MMPKISLMQGRLLPQFEDRLQGFPVREWEKEFHIGKKLGLYSIEWIYEKPYWKDNPLSSDKGIVYLKRLVQETDILVKSICADYYMTEPLIKNGQVCQTNRDHLIWLLYQAKKLDITYIILPFVDSSSLKSSEDHSAIVELLRKVLMVAELLEIEIHLEADLPLLNFQKIFEEINHPLLKMNYDIGNSASLGYEVDDEMAHLGKYLGSIHVKDRLLGGGTVTLGKGNADLPGCFRWFYKLGFNRWYVLQAARGIEYEEEAHIGSLINITRDLINGTWVRK